MHKWNVAFICNDIIEMKDAVFDNKIIIILSIKKLEADSKYSAANVRHAVRPFQHISIPTALYPTIKLPL